MICVLCREPGPDLFPCDCRAGFHLKCFGEMMLNGFWKRCAICTKRWCPQAVLQALENADVDQPNTLLQKGLALLQCGQHPEAKRVFQKLQTYAGAYGTRAKIELARMTLSSQTADEVAVAALRECAEMEHTTPFLKGLCQIYLAQAYLASSCTDKAEETLVQAFQNVKTDPDLCMLGLRSAAECAKRRGDVSMQIHCWGTIAEFYALRHDEVGKHCCLLEKSIVEMMNGADSSETIKQALLVLRRHTRTDQPVLKRGRCFLSVARQPTRRLRQKTHPEDM